MSEKELELQEAIKVIEDKSVYRCTALIDNGSAYFVSTNGMSQTLWTRKKIIGLSKIMKNKPEGL